MSEKMFYKV